MPVRADVACKALPRVCNPLRNGSFIALPLQVLAAREQVLPVESGCRDLLRPGKTRQRDPSEAPKTHPAPHKLALARGSRCRAAHFALLPALGRATDRSGARAIGPDRCEDA